MICPVKAWDGCRPALVLGGIPLAQDIGAITRPTVIAGSLPIHGVGCRIIAAPGTGSIVLAGCGSRATVGGEHSEMAGTR